MLSFLKLRLALVSYKHLATLVQSTFMVGPEPARGETLTTKLSLAEEMRQVASARQGQQEEMYESAGTAVQQAARPALSTCAHFTHSDGT